MRPLRYLWALPTTCVGLVAVLLTLATRGRAKAVQGCLECHGGFATWLLAKATPLPGGANAMTLGHVILGLDKDCLDWSREHEHVHVRQAERWGVFFLPAYLGASAWLWLRGKDAYRENPFEKEAYGRRSC
jgi:hypothetical protein